MLEAIKHGIERINTAVGYVSGFFVLLIGCILFIEVFMRSLGMPTEWIPEWSVYLFGWATLGGAAYTLMKGRHVRVELLMMHLSPKAGRILDMVTAFGGALFCAMVAVHGWEHFMDVLDTGETTATTLRIPLWFKDFPLFAGFVLLTVQFLLIIVDRYIEIKLLDRFGAPKTPAEGGHA